MMKSNPDRDYSQLRLISYMLLKAREKLLGFSIGSSILKANLFDDVFCELHYQEKSLVYLFDVKSHRYKHKTIKCSDLAGASPRWDFDLLQYFKAYLQVRKAIDQPIEELVVWTESVYDRKDFALADMLLDYTSAKNAVDLFGADELGIRRHRISHLVAIEETLLRSCDPLYKLARTLSRLMFSKKTVSVETIPKEFYYALRRDVFVGNGFRREFLRASNILCSEAKQFHNFLVIVLSEHFRQRNMADFSKLNQIEQRPFAELVELRIESCELDLTTKDSSWKVDYVVDRSDVEQFFSMLVFYTNVPDNQELTNILSKYFDQTTQDVLRRVFQPGIILQNLQVEAIFKLISLKKSEEVRSLECLWFESEALVDLRNILLKFRSQSTSDTCVIVSCGEMAISKCRISSILRELDCNYLCISSRDFLEKRNELLHIMQELKSLERWTLVITTENSSIIETLGEIESLFKVIVITAFSNDKMDFVIYEDQFCFNDLSETIKERLQSSSVLLHGHAIGICALLSEESLSTIPAPALLDWCCNCDHIAIGHETKEFFEDYFVPRQFQSVNFVVNDPFEMDFEPISILSGLPGSGKTSMLKRMVVNFQEKFNDHIVIMENFNRIVDWVDATVDSFKMIAKLMDVDLMDRFLNFVLQKMVEERRVILLLDGLDEISLVKEGNALAMLQWIGNADFKLVMIATRTHTLPVLKNELKQSVVYSMLPFNETDQLNFLEHGMQGALLNENRIHDLIRSFRVLFKDEHFLETPLQCTIVACIYEGHNTINEWNVADILQKYVDAKFELYVNKFFDLLNKAHEAAVDALRASFLTEHSKLAFKMHTHQVIEDDCFEEFEQFGLLRRDDRQISFIHLSIAEFFQALYLLRHYVSQDLFNDYLKEHFCNPTSNQLDIFLEHHIREASNCRKLDGCRPSILNSDLKEFRTQQTHRTLHTDKIKQFHLFFVECCSVEKLIAYIQTSISKGQFGIFETIYQSLPICLFQVVRFAFGSNSNNPLSVDLSTIHENYLLETLTILHRQHLEDVVQKIIASYASDEDDFVSTAIIRNYRNVMQYLFTIEKSLTSESESDLLLEYVERRWQQYLTLGIQCGRADLISETLESIEKRFHPRMIKYFLMTRSALKVLFDSCKSEEASVEAVNRVIRFVEQYLSDFDLRLLLKRTMAQEGMLGCKLSNQQVRTTIEALRKRYGTDE